MIRVSLARYLALLLLVSAAEAASPPALYLYEGFDGPGLPSGWSQHQILGPLASWTVVGTGTHPPVPPFAGTGQAQFNSYDASSGEQSRLVTPAVNLISSPDPFAEFMVYHDDEFITSLDSLYVEVSTGDSIIGPWTTLIGIQRPDSPSGWERISASLLAVSGSPRVFVGLRGVSKYGNNIFIDQFRVADSSFHDLGTIALLDVGATQRDVSAAERSRFDLRESEPSPGRTLSRLMGDSLLTAIVRNYGTYSELAYELYWDVDFNLQFPIQNPDPLPRNGLDTFLLPLPELEPGIHHLRAWTVLSSDSNRSNDTTRMTLLVADTAVIFFESFNGGTFPPTDWITINRDSGALGPWFRGSPTTSFPPFEGGGYAANNFQRANGQHIDDYLITPTISGIGQPGLDDSLTLWVRSAFNPPPFENFPDSLMILLSTTGNDTGSFTILLDYLAVPKGVWTSIAYRLSPLVPANSTIHIAFRYLHYAGGVTGANSDFVGVDAIQVKRGLPTSVHGFSPLPHTLALEQNYPNPFNPVTRIRYHVPRSGMVTMSVHDILGRHVSTLMNGEVRAGIHTVEWNASSVASGVYFCRLGSNGVTSTMRMLLLR